MGQQVFVAPPPVQGHVRLPFGPGCVADAEQLVAAGHAGGKEDDRPAALDERPDLPRHVARGNGCLPQQQRDTVPIDGRHLAGGDQLGCALDRGIRRDRRGQLQRASGLGVVDHDDRPPRGGLLEDEPEVVVSRIGVGRNRDPPPAAVPALLQRNRVVSELGLAAGE